MCSRMFSMIRIAPAACVSHKTEKRQTIPIVCTPPRRKVRHKAAVYHRCGFLLADKICMLRRNPIARVRRSHVRADTCGHGTICVGVCIVAARYPARSSFAKPPRCGVLHMRVKTVCCVDWRWYSVAQWRPLPAWLWIAVVFNMHVNLAS